MKVVSVSLVRICFICTVWWKQLLYADCNLNTRLTFRLRRFDLEMYECFLKVHAVLERPKTIRGAANHILHLPNVFGEGLGCGSAE